MKDSDLYSGVVSPEKQAEYEAWLVEKYGPEIHDHIAVSRQKLDKLTDSDRAALMAELESIEQGLAEGLRRGIPPQAASLDRLVARHRKWVGAMWNQPAPLEAYAGLADTYLGHPDFVARYERIEPGFAQYLASAMRSWVRRQQG